MNNFFKFEKDILFEDAPHDPSMKFRFQAYANTAWFNLNGYAYPNSDGSPTIFKIEDAVLLPVGSYALDLNRDLKGSPLDAVYLISKDGSQKEIVRNDSIQVEKQQYFDLVFEFKSNSRYLVGDNFDFQEDYGKDYEIIIKLISGGLYERERKIAVLKGDLDEDGAITYKDLVLMNLLEFGANFEGTDTFRWDIDNDGDIGGIDNLILEKYLKGKESLYQVEFIDEVQYE